MLEALQSGLEAGQEADGAGQGWGPQTTVLTCTLAILKGVARLAGESLVAAEGAYCVHAVLSPAARVQVCHALVDVCRESDAIRGRRVLPGQWLSAASTGLKVFTARKVVRS